MASWHLVGSVQLQLRSMLQATAHGKQLGCLLCSLLLRTRRTLVVWGGAGGYRADHPEQRGATLLRLGVPPQKIKQPSVVVGTQARLSGSYFACFTCTDAYFLPGSSADRETTCL